MAEKIVETIEEVESSERRGPQVRTALRREEGAGVDGRRPVRRQQRGIEVRGRGGRRLGVGGRRRRFLESTGRGVSGVSEVREKGVRRNLMMGRAVGREDLGRGRGAKQRVEDVLLIMAPCSPLPNLPFFAPYLTALMRGCVHMSSSS